MPNEDERALRNKNRELEGQKNISTAELRRLDNRRNEIAVEKRRLGKKKERLEMEIERLKKEEETLDKKRFQQTENIKIIEKRLKENRTKMSKAKNE
ncbi:MAG: hypothetical protein ACOCUF_01470 [Patescibacteria group bacterium]